VSSVDGGDSRCEDICKYVRSSHEQLAELTTPHDKKINILQNAALCCKISIQSAPFHGKGAL